MKKSSKTFTDGPFWRAGVPKVGGRQAVPFVHKLSKRVFCIFARNRNDNLAVFEGKVEGGKLVNIDHYWLSIEPSFIRKARKKGINHDREEMTVFDDIAYGFSKSSNKTKPNRFQVTMNQLKGRSMVVILENGEVNAYVKLKNRLCKLSYIWVQDNKEIWAKVQYIDIFGYDVRTKQLIQERINK